MEKSSNAINVNDLLHLKFNKVAEEYIVTLVDEEGFEILRGFGKTLVKAINDLHQNLI